jgi:hypothetical protein
MTKELPELRAALQALLSTCGVHKAVFSVWPQNAINPVNMELVGGAGGPCHASRATAWREGVNDICSRLHALGARNLLQTQLVWEAPDYGGENWDLNTGRGGADFAARCAP